MFWLNCCLFLSLFLRLSSGFCNPPCFTITPISPLQVTQGEAIIIRWKYSANIPLQLAQWGSFDKDGKIKVLIAQKHGNNKIEYFSSYKDRASIENDNSSLRLLDMKSEDAGYFGCTFKFQGGYELKNITRLEVTSSSGKDATHDHRKLYWIFVGVVLLLVVLVVIYIYLERKKRQKLRQQSVKTTSRPQSHVLINMEELDSGHLTDNDDNYHIIPPVGFNPATRQWEIPRDNIVVIKVIGKGAFGLVAKGIVQLESDTNNVIVALKMLRKDASEEDKRDFLAELDLMKTLDHHHNVISLYGCVSKSEPYYMITEFVPFGDLLGHLRKSRGLKDTYFDDPDIKPVSSLTSRQLFTYSWHIANGMAYLSSKKIVHRDLAARNVLVGEGEMCKITDFGLARDVHQQNVYTRTSKGRLPVKWTAYESLLYGECTTMSDVWSYGVVLYEIFTIGGSPFPKTEGKEVVSILQEGQRMPRPKHLDKELYEVMMDCWQEKPDQRPTFATLRERIKDMESFHERYVRLSEYDSKLYENLDDLQV